MAIATRSIVLVNVNHPYRAALRTAATVHRLVPIEVPGELSESRQEQGPALAVIEMNGVEAEALERLRAVRKVLKRTPCVVLARNIRPEMAFRLSTLGVRDVIEIPACEREVATRCLSHTTRNRSSEIPELVGESPALRGLRREISFAAESRATVLLSGETGTGKNVVARAIHRLGPRRDTTFVHVDCSALSPTLIESELFGHERGAFTGAVTRRAGRFELVKDGTILLDEIGDVELPLQSKFLRVLEEREYERVGGASVKRMEARVVAATSRDLKREVAEGRFRDDLYFRLGVLQIHLPPLRERIADIPLLVEAGLERIARRLDMPAPGVSPGFCERLMRHPWAGNVRELLNVLEAALVRSRSPQLDERSLDGLLDSRAVVATCSTPAPMAPPLADEPRPDELAGNERNERAELVQLLTATGGNVARVARRIGLARSTVRYKIRRYGLTEFIPRD